MGAILALTALGVGYGAAFVFLIRRNLTLRERQDAEARRRAAMTDKEREDAAYQDMLDLYW